MAGSVELMLCCLRVGLAVAADVGRVMANLIKVLDKDRPGHKFDGEDPIILSFRLHWAL